VMKRSVYALVQQNLEHIWVRSLCSARRLRLLTLAIANKAASQLRQDLSKFAGAFGRCTGPEGTCSSEERSAKR
jgi:hypothetical protein